MKVSTGYQDALASKLPEVTGLINATSIAFVDGGAGSDSITDSGNGFVSAGFKVGDKIRVDGSTSNDGDYTILTVAAGTITVATGSLTGESAGDQVAIVASRGGALRDILDFGVIEIYSGAQPSNADQAESGTKLAIITNGGATFTPSTKDSAGLRFGDAASGIISVLAGQTWKTDACLASGIAGWGRYYANSRVQGASTVAVRLDFSIGVSGADLNLVTTQLQAGLPFVISSFSIEVR